MTDKKIIAVFGATGNQGSGLVDAILDDPASEFAVRVLTRTVDSDAAKAYAAKGAEVVQVDVDDATSVEKALRGAYGAFCVTFYFPHLSPEKEKEQAKNMANASKKAGLKHVIWSTLEDTREHVALDDDRMPTLFGKYKVPHLDGKAEANQYFTEAGVPTTFFLTCFYWDNLINFGMGPRKNEDGSYTFALPMGNKRLPGVAAADIGRCCYSIFKSGDAMVGKTVGVSGEHLTGEQMAETLSSVLKVKVSYQAIPFDVYRGSGRPGADDLGNMFQFKHDFQEAYCGARSVEQSKKLNPDMLNFRQWLEKRKDEIPL